MRREERAAKKRREEQLREMAVFRNRNLPKMSGEFMLIKPEDMEHKWCLVDLDPSKGTMTIKTDHSATEMQNRERSRVTECGCWAALLPWGAAQCPSNREYHLLKHLVIVETDFSKRAIVLHFDNRMNSRCCQILCLISVSEDAIDSWSQVLAQYDDAQSGPMLNMSMLKHECSAPLGDEQGDQEMFIRTEGTSSFKDGALGIPVEVATKHRDEGVMSKSSSFSEDSTEFNEASSDTRQMSD
jgi:hypothetical protein